MAFPTTSVLDDFNRADTGPPPSTSWTSNLVVGDTLQVISNQLGASAAGDAYWNVATYGPDSEIYVAVPVLPTSGFRLFIRVAQPGETTVDAYSIDFFPTITEIRFQRWADGAPTQLGASISYALNANDRTGFEALGSDLTYYRDTGGGFAAVDSRSDSTYSSAGYIGIRLQDTTERLDNFGGGTVVVVVVTPRVRVNVARGAIW